MKPRSLTLADLHLWGDGAEIIEMRGEHLGAENIKVIRHPDGVVRVPWVSDERDGSTLLDGVTVWTTFYGGMLPTDVVMTIQR